MLASSPVSSAKVGYVCHLSVCSAFFVVGSVSYMVWFGTEYISAVFIILILQYDKVCHCVSSMYIYNVSTQFVLTSFCCDCDVWYFHARLVGCVSSYACINSYCTVVVPCSCSCTVYSRLPLFLVVSVVLLRIIFFVVHNTIRPTKRTQNLQLTYFFI
jgi:hypothetical protein